VLLGGISLGIATILFAAVFSYLAVAFDYPAVLDRPAEEVLPALLSLGGLGRFVWVIYSLIPMLLLPTGRGVRDAAHATSPRLGQAAVWLATISAVAMMTGLLRWPTLQWQLAQEWTSASPVSRELLAGRFATANLYIGNVIGEFAGELFLNAFFLTAALILAAPRPHPRRWLAVAGAAASALGWVAMLRNITSVVAPAAALNNIVLPLWMLLLALALATTPVNPHDAIPRVENV
jgi:hypothetical protein